MKNFWYEFKDKGPILALAPMADVTDSAFRYIISKNSDIPHVTWTEFVSADGLALAPEAGRKKLLKDLEYTEIERPIVAQFFTSRPENMKKAAALALELGFDGVDINMGCPDKSIEKQGAGASLIKNPKLARELIRAAKEGVQDKIPVSVKTRIGYNKDELEEPARIDGSLGGWIPEILAESPAALTVHLRTRKEMSKVEAHWDRMKRIVEIRDEVQGMPRGTLGTHTFILGNGDVKSVEEAEEKCRETGCDGVMLGRAIFGNPFLFRKNSPSVEERIGALIEHIELFDKNLGGVKSFAVMKKHFKAYLSGIDHELKIKMLESNSSEEALSLLKSFLVEKVKPLTG